jgi:hypothetical protein
MHVLHTTYSLMFCCIWYEELIYISIYVRISRLYVQKQQTNL